MEQGGFNEVAKKALEFRQRYYEALDDQSKRGNIASYYAPDVPNLCEWNGHSLPDVNAINNYVASLPSTSHKIKMVDAQPLPGNERGDSFLMTVYGDVTYDNEHVRSFFQRMVVRRANDRHYILNDYYRWLAGGEN